MKNLLLVSQHYDDCLYQSIKRDGYQITHCDFKELEGISESNQHLGVIDLRGYRDLILIERLLDGLHSHMLIVIIVNRQQLKNTDIKRVIGKYAWDYHTEPIDHGRFFRMLGHASGLSTLKRISQSSLKSENESMLIHSPVMQALDEQISRVAPTDIPVLIRGESGTGKELVALNIHQESRRASGPFVAVNCGSMVSGLVQSELFGHARGAFTGAVAERKGKIELADTGTLFLDEIGDLPLDQQANLLRFLQEGVFDKVGGTGACKANVRILAATHIDLDVAISKGEFRLDLYYRLNGVTLHTPTLQQRSEDILPLARQFVDVFAREFDFPGCHLTDDACRALQRHDWPGNVRELINRVRRAVVLSDKGRVNAAALDLVSVKEIEVLPLKVLKNQVERSAIINAMQLSNGHAEQAATHLQVSRATLYRLLEKHDIDQSEELCLKNKN
ncbi:sigma-54 dependent transcriptional regulator [Shewanella nanhaiensis]|uniref:Sigma-54 dependent transcriptional regulator n=1 Tax=Shewanella nanhaiensis TaxID=2864872 RepID=A0ABS7E080_9GAMM|nr:sigma-54 dependent transcriptional regulator [Shewanella nanhaiensis]MBW8182581.1 sigma-54 dependent transcriptional regulator [Shewanella nanhaiensis]